MILKRTAVLVTSAIRLAVGIKQKTPPCKRYSRRINPLPQFLAGLEMRDELLRHLNLVASFGIPARALRSIVDREAAKSADLNALTLNKAPGHRVEDRLYRDFHVLCDKLRITRGETRDKVGLCHA